MTSMTSGKSKLFDGELGQPLRIKKISKYKISSEKGSLDGCSYHIKFFVVGEENYDEKTHNYTIRNLSKPSSDFQTYSIVQGSGSMHLKELPHSYSYQNVTAHP